MGSTPDQLPADALAGYELGEVCGTGLAGRIRAGRHAATGAAVAVEVIDPPLGTDSNFRERLQAEVERATVLEHQSIVAVYETVCSDDRVAVVTDPLRPGCAAHQLRDKHGMPLAATLLIADHVLQALACAHRAGMVHGAIGPPIVHVQAASVRVSGFAVARALHPQLPDEAATDTRAVGFLVIDLTAGSGATRYARLPRHVRVVLARAASARPERQYRTAAGMRAALIDAAKRDLGQAWREHATKQLTALTSTPAVDVPASHDCPVPTEADGLAGVASADPAPPAAVIRGVRLDLRRRRWTPARVLRTTVAAVALVTVAVVVGVAGGLVASAIRGRAPMAAGALSVAAVSLEVQPTRASCNSTFVGAATASVHGTGTLEYQWKRSDGEATATTALVVTARDNSFLITQHWHLSGQVSHPALTFNLISPVAMTITKPLQYTCP